MSGGSLDYIYYKVEEAGLEVKRRATTPLQKAFGTHLLKLSQVLKEVEWEFSGDSSNADEAIKELFGKQAKFKELEVLRDEARNWVVIFQECLERLDEEYGE